MQLGINVTDCNQMIQMIEEFASSTDNYFRELIANGVEVGSQHAKYVNARTEKYIKKLSIIKKRTLNCFKNRDDITVLICIHQVNAINHIKVRTLILISHFIKYINF